MEIEKKNKKAGNVYVMFFIYNYDTLKKKISLRFFTQLLLHHCHLHL
jgi:hypothetical protein